MLLFFFKTKILTPWPITNWNSFARLFIEHYCAEDNYKRLSLKMQRLVGKQKGLTRAARCRGMLLRAAPTQSCPSYFHCNTISCIKICWLLNEQIRKCVANVEKWKVFKFFHGDSCCVKIFYLNGITETRDNRDVQPEDRDCIEKLYTKFFVVENEVLFEEWGLYDFHTTACAISWSLLALGGGVICWMSSFVAQTEIALEGRTIFW